MRISNGMWDKDSTCKPITINEKQSGHKVMIEVATSRSGQTSSFLIPVDISNQALGLDLNQLGSAPTLLTASTKTSFTGPSHCKLFGVRSKFGQNSPKGKAANSESTAMAQRVHINWSRSTPSTPVTRGTTRHTDLKTEAVKHLLRHKSPNAKSAPT